jgi:L-fucose isomerase-like protein
MQAARPSRPFLPAIPVLLHAQRARGVPVRGRSDALVCLNMQAALNKRSEPAEDSNN